MTRLEKILLAVLISIAVFLWIEVGWGFISNTWRAPLGPQLSFPSLATPQSANIQPLILSTLTGLTPIIQANKPNQAGESAPFCGGPKSMTILAIGSDTRAQSYLYGLSDVIRYVRIDFVTPRVSVLEFPRDLWVEIPEIENHYGITHGKLNQAYLYGNPGMGYTQGPDQGPGLLARTLDLNFGARPDHYIAANMQAFVRLVNTVGGIDINLPYSVDARNPDQQGRSDLYFPAGEHHLSGDQALMLGRLRPVSVFRRADQQNRILCGLRNKILTPSILPKIPEIISSFNNAVQTDMSPEQLSQLACLAPKIKSNNITFTTFPRELLTATRTFDIGVKKDVYIFTADFNTLRLFVKAFNLGAWPDNKPVDPSIATPRPHGEGNFNCP